MAREETSAARSSLRRRLGVNVRTLGDPRATPDERRHAALVTGATALGAGALGTTAIAEAVGQLHQHQQAVHAIMATGDPAVVAWSAGIGGYIFIATGIGVATDRRAHGRRYSEADRQAIAARIGGASKLAGVTSASAAASAVGFAVAEHAGHLNALGGLVGGDTKVAAGALTVAGTAAIGARLARGRSRRAARRAAPPNLGEG